jgi:hypothetical protein
MEMRSDARPGIEAASLAEIRKLKETADRWASGDGPDEADPVRVLAGLIHQLAQQVERLVQSSPRDGSVSPGEPPAEPVNDRTLPDAVGSEGLT